MHDQIKVLFLAADPYHEGASLRLDEEVRAVDHAIRRARARDSVELVPHFATRTRDIREALLQHEPQIVHFAGHGASSGGIYLGDEYGRRTKVEREALRTLFRLVSPPVRVVVLNGCNTLSTIELLSEVVDQAVGMNSVISDQSAIVFAEAFYSAVAMGRPVSTAFEFGVCQLEMEGNPESAIPVRLVRAGAEADLCLVAPRAAGEAERAGDAPQARAGEKAAQVQEFSGTLKMRDGLFENAPRPGSTPGGQINRFKDVDARDLTFRNQG